MRSPLGALLAALVAATAVSACQSVEVQIETVLPELGDCPLREAPRVEYRSGDCAGEGFQPVDGQPVTASLHCFRALAHTECGQVAEGRVEADLSDPAQRVVRIELGPPLDDVGARGCASMRVAGAPLEPLGVAPVTSSLAAGPTGACGLDAERDGMRLVPRCWGLLDAETSELAVLRAGVSDLASVRVPRETSCEVSPTGSLACGGAVPAWFDAAWVPAGGLVRHAALGGELACAAVEKGTTNLHGEVWCWAADRDLLPRVDCTTPSPGAPPACEVLVAGGAFGARAPVVADLCAGDAHACALLDGAVYCWGRDGEGQVGAGTCDRERGCVDGTWRIPQPVPLPASATGLACGGSFTCATVFDPAAGPRVWCWGRASERALGRARGTSPAEICVAAAP